MYKHNQSFNSSTTQMENLGKETREGNKETDKKQVVDLNYLNGPVAPWDKQESSDD